MKQRMTRIEEIYKSEIIQGNEEIIIPHDIFPSSPKNSPLTRPATA